MTPEEYAIEHVIAVLEEGKRGIGPAAALIAARSLLDCAIKEWERDNKKPPRALMADKGTFEQKWNELVRTNASINDLAKLAEEHGHSMSLRVASTLAQGEFRTIITHVWGD